MTDAATDAGAPGAFSVSPDGERWTYTGALTFDNAASVLEGVLALPLPRSGRVDLAALDPADSAALAALFALKRHARSAHRKLVFEHMPPGLASLAKVYGVDALLEVQ